MFRFPRRVTLLLWLVLGFTAWNAVRLATSIAWRDTLGQYAPHPGSAYIGASGALWTGTGLFLLWSFWCGRRWTRPALLITSGLYAVWVWADRFFVQAQIRANWPFALLATVVLLGFVAAVVLDPHHNAYFERETYERKS
jgi:hypothetical protein